MHIRCLMNLYSLDPGTLRLVIDFTQHRLVEASFQGKSSFSCSAPNEPLFPTLICTSHVSGLPIKAHDCLSLCFNAFGGHTHPLVHSFANWGVNPHVANAFVRRMSLITIKVR